MPACYIGISNAPKKVKQIWIGINNKPTKVKKGYIGVGGKPQLFFTSEGIEYASSPQVSLAIDAIAGIDSTNTLICTGNVVTTCRGVKADYTTFNMGSTSVAARGRMGVTGTTYAFFAGGANNYSTLYTNVDMFNSNGTRTPGTALSYGAFVNGCSFNGNAVFGCTRMGNMENDGSQRIIYYYNGTTGARTNYTSTTAYRDLASFEATSTYLYIAGGDNGNTGVDSFEVFNTSLSKIGLYNDMPRLCVGGGSGHNSSNEVLLFGGNNYYSANTYTLRLQQIKNTTITNITTNITDYVTNSKWSFNNFGAGNGKYVVFLGGKNDVDDSDDNPIVLEPGGVYNQTLSKEMYSNSFSIDGQEGQTRAYGNRLAYAEAGQTKLAIWEVNS